MKTIYRNIVAGLITSRDNKFLLGMKDPKGGGVYADCWHIPGGGIEASETDLQALAREMSEELGIDITDATITLLDDKGQGEAEKTLKDTNETVLCKMQFYVYRIAFDKDAKDIKVTPGDDIQKTIWVDPNTLSSYRLTPPSIELFTRLNWL